MATVLAAGCHHRNEANARELMSELQRHGVDIDRVADNAHIYEMAIPGNLRPPLQEGDDVWFGSILLTRAAGLDGEPLFWEIYNSNGDHLGPMPLGKKTLKVTLVLF